MPRPTDRSLLQKLKQKKVVQWAIAYLSAGWLLLQVVDIVGDQFDWPAAIGRATTILLSMGVPVVVVLAWYHGEKGHQRVTRTETLLLAALALLGAGALVATLGANPGGDVAGDPPGSRVTVDVPVDTAAVAVLPFVSATEDTSLTRLGRELAVTLSATLDGIAEFRTVDAVSVLAQAPPGVPPPPLQEARARARRLGAGRLLRGTVTRQAGAVRVDAALHGPGEEVTRVSAEGEAEDLAGLTDSLALALLRRVWQGSTPELPSPAALDTRSGAALRAYVEGEEAMARGEMTAAVAAFERAFAHDSTYLFAYWRSLYPRIYEGSDPDPRIVERLVAQRERLPAADRLLLEARQADRAPDELAILEAAARRFPAHWPTWFTYANALIHWAPFLGTGYAEARDAIERVVALNPGLAGAWEHLLWITAVQRDTAATARILERLEAFAGSPDSRYNQDALMLYRTVAKMVTAGDRPSAAFLRRTAEYIRDYNGPIPAPAFGIGLLIYELPRTTVLLADEVLALGPDADLVASMWRGKAYGWVGRGAWDSAAVAVDWWTRTDGSWPAALAGYGLLATGAALGLVDPATAARARPAGAGEDRSDGERAELAWLDGVVAYATGDPTALDAAARRLAALEDARFRELLGGSLRGLHLDATGRRDEAIRALTSAEDSAAARWAQFGYRFDHPYVATVDRVLLGRWLVEDGRHAEALRLLTWTEAVLPGAPPLEVANRTAGLLGLYERGRAEEAMGRHGDARVRYLRFLQRVDRPVDSLRPLVRDAAERAQRLAPRVRG